MCVACPPTVESSRILAQSLGNLKLTVCQRDPPLIVVSLEAVFHVEFGPTGQLVEFVTAGWFGIIKSEPACNSCFTEFSAVNSQTSGVGIS